MPSMTMFRNFKQTILVLLFTASSIVKITKAEWALFTTDLEANAFTTTYLNGWSYSQISSCSLDVSPPDLIRGNNMTKTFSSLPPHFKARATFELYLIDSIGNLQNLPNEKVRLSADNIEVFSIRPDQIPISSPSSQVQFWQCSSGDWCGSTSSNSSNPTQFNDWTCSFSVEFSHFNSTLELEFFDTFITNSLPYKSWGIRSLIIEINKCFERCSSCVGEWVNNCSSCSPTQVLDNDNSCQCPPSLYYQNFECLALDTGLSTCDNSLVQAMTQIYVLPSSVILQHIDEPYLHISVDFSFNLTSSVIPDSCQSQLSTVLLHKNYDSQTTSSYIQFSDAYTPYFAYNSSFPSSLQFNLPLNLSLTNLSDSSQASFSIIDLSIHFGNTVELLRQNRFLVYIQNTTTFAVNIDPEITDGCNPSDDNCISIIGISTESFLCTDVSCDTPRTNSTFTIGDSLIVKIRFKDHTLQQYISLLSAYYKGEDTLIDVTGHLQTLSSQNGYSIFALELLYSSSNCILQLSLEFTDQLNNRRRFLQTSKQNNPVIQQNGNPTQSQSSPQTVQIKSFTVNPKIVISGSDILKILTQSAIFQAVAIFLILF